MKTYKGYADGDVWVEEQKGPAMSKRLLDPRLDLYNHSPTGFSWGYSGSGPAQLALAILADVTGDKRTALAHYQDYKGDVIANLKQAETFAIEASSVIDWIVRRTSKDIDGDRHEV